MSIQRIDDWSSIPASLGIVCDPAPEVTDAVVGVIRSQTAGAKLLWLETPSYDPGVMKMIVASSDPFDGFSTQWFVDVGAMREAGIDHVYGIAFALVSAALLITPLAPISAVTLLAAAKPFLSKLRRMTEDQAEVAHNILTLSAGKAYSRSLPEDDLRRAFSEATIDVDEIVDDLIGLGVVIRRHDGLRLVY